MTEIVQGVHLVDGSNANSYVIEEADGSLIVVDSGMQSSGRKILDYISGSMKRKPSDVKTIVITHGHVDHLRGAAAIKTATGAKLACHLSESDYVSGRLSYPAPKGATGVLFGLLGSFFRVQPLEPDMKLTENDKVGRFAVLHTPGHTPGSISLYDEAGRVLLVGDTARYMGGSLVGPPPQFTPDMAGAKASIERLSGLTFEVMLSGHGDPLKSKDAPAMMKNLATRLKSGDR